MTESTTPLPAEDGDDDHWLASYSVHCEKCQATLLMLEHSPFENGYYLYCDTCPRRVDVSVYDSAFQEIEQQVSDTHTAQEMDSNYLGLVMPAVEARLRPCACTGHFKFGITPRCLYCATPVANAREGFNVWPADHDDADTEQTQRDEALLQQLILNEDLWQEKP